MDKKQSSEKNTEEYNEESNWNDRIPTLDDIANRREEKTNKIRDIKVNIVDKMNFCPKNKTNYILYNNNNFGYREDLARRILLKKEYGFYTYCFISVCISFLLGLIIGIVLMSSSQSQILNANSVSRKLTKLNDSREILTRTLNSLQYDEEYKTGNKIEKDNVKQLITKVYNRYPTVSFTGETHRYSKDIYPKTLTEDMKDILKDNKEIHKHSIVKIKANFVPNDQTVLYDNIYWGPKVEDSMPQGYGEDTGEIWERYVNQSEVIKMENGCGRMQNRLVTFKDGIQACVRYRQNTDQIQGEIFSFYVAKLLNLTNLAPSVIKVVDLKDKLWQSVATDVVAAQWNTNRAVVLTQYIPSLESATIPDIFKPNNRHLNKYDVLKMSMKENDTVSKEILIDKLKTKNVKVKKDVNDNFDHLDVSLNKNTVKLFVELAQWSDLIIFDYLTANLDRIVNNLFNYQWNINIMDGPAHNLARKMDSGLLLFLDNESGLLHGYRLLKKYNVYHSLMLDNLCVFRKSTVEALRKLFDMQSIGVKLSDLFHRKNNAVIRDILPPLPEKNAKILHERIGKVLNQIEKCELNFDKR